MSGVVLHNRGFLWGGLGPGEVVLEEQEGGFGGRTGLLGVTTERLFFVSLAPRAPMGFWIDIPLERIVRLAIAGPWRLARGCRLSVELRSERTNPVLQFTTHGGGVARANELIAAATSAIASAEPSALDDAPPDATLSITQSAERQILRHGGTAWVYYDTMSVPAPSVSYEPPSEVLFLQMTVGAGVEIHVAEEFRWFSGLKLVRSPLRRSGVRAKLAPAPIP